MQKYRKPCVISDNFELSLAPAPAAVAAYGGAAALASAAVAGFLAGVSKSNNSRGNKQKILKKNSQEISLQE